jgi:signal peptidase I
MDDFHADQTTVLPERRLRLSAERVDIERRKTAGEARGSISTGRWMWEWTKAISTAVLLFLVIRTFLFEAFKIPTGSMEGTLLVGDFLLVNKAVYGAEIPGTHSHLPAFSQPGRGDVIVFLPPHDPHRNYVKRIVGVGGDTLQMRDKVLYLNGTPQVEPFVRHTDPLTDPPHDDMLWQLQYLVERPRHWSDYRPTRDNWGPIVVPPGEVLRAGRQPRQQRRLALLGVPGGQLHQGAPHVRVLFVRKRKPLALLVAQRGALGPHRRAGRLKEPSQVEDG